MKEKAFIIRPVRGIDEEYKKKIEAEIELIKKEYEVYDPLIDTDQNDSKGLYICKQNRSAIIDADVVIIFWDGKSQGCLFDLGMAFALNKKIIPWNGYFPPEDSNGKSFWNMVWTLFKENQEVEE